MIYRHYQNMIALCIFGSLMLAGGICFVFGIGRAKKMPPDYDSDKLDHST